MLIYVYIDLYGYLSWIYVSICLIYHLFGYSLPFPKDKLQNVSSPYFTYQDDVEKFSFLCLCLLALICITLSFKLLSTSRIPDLFFPLFVNSLLSSKSFKTKFWRTEGITTYFVYPLTKIPQVMQLSTFRIKFMCIFNSNIQSRMILVKNKISNLDLCSIQHKKCISIYRVLRLPRKRKLDLCSLNDSTETKVLKEFNENQKVQKRA